MQRAADNRQVAQGNGVASAQTLEDLFFSASPYPILGAFAVTPDLSLNGGVTYAETTYPSDAKNKAVIHTVESTETMGNVGDQVTLQKTLSAANLPPVITSTPRSFEASIMS